MILIPQPQTSILTRFFQSRRITRMKHTTSYKKLLMLAHKCMRLYSVIELNTICCTRLPVSSKSSNLMVNFRKNTSLGLKMKSIKNYINLHLSHQMTQELNNLWAILKKLTIHFHIKNELIINRLASKSLIDLIIIAKSYNFI